MKTIQVQLVAGLLALCAIQHASGKSQTSDATGGPQLTTQLASRAPFLVVANGSGASLSVFAVHSDGALSEIAGSPFAASPGVDLVRFCGAKTLVASASSGPAIGAPSTLELYQMANDGSLAAVGGILPVAQDVRPFACVRKGTRRFVVIPAASFAGDRLHEFELVDQGPNAHLEPMPWSPLPLTGLMLFGGAAATPDGERVYQMGYSSSFRGFALGADGFLTPLNLQAAAQGQLTNAVVAPDGRHLYCTRDTNPDRVVGYAITPGGGLSELPSSPFVLPAPSSFPSHIILSPNGQFVVAGSSGGNAVTVMRRQQDGQLVISAGGTLVLGGAPGAVACDDEHLFVLGDDAAGVAHVFVFELTSVQSGPTHAAVVPTGARDLALAPPAGS